MNGSWRCGRFFNKTTIANKTFPIPLLGCHGSVRIFIASVCYCSHFSFIIQINFDFPCIFLKQVVQEENTQYFLEKKKLKETVKQLTEAVSVPRSFLFIFALKHNFMSQDFSFTHTITIFDFYVCLKISFLLNNFKLNLKKVVFAYNIVLHKTLRGYLYLFRCRSWLMKTRACQRKSLAWLWRSRRDSRPWWNRKLLWYWRKTKYNNSKTSIKKM